MTVMAIKPQTSTFLATRFEQRLVRTPQRKIRDNRSGEITGTTDPDRIEFRNGTYTAKDADEADWLREHRLFNDPVDGFREMPQATPAPTAQEFDAIMQFAGDPDALESLLLEETANWDRPVLTELLRGAIDRLNLAIAEPAAV